MIMEEGYRKGIENSSKGSSLTYMYSMFAFIRTVAIKLNTYSEDKSEITFIVSTQ